ncbi:hypothetical protein GCK72_015476 [Caenorhabditis remanei]|uniref:Protein kinase domain-containing protein n=1 Tax=Caenorhabditis remanei TaxID=31234 RepID=A0A6A5GWM3_CAERE|nr:hypothetical protein GCK72_015476 [Caenorhabditis remanei]KAF1759016.1 hypothetical protein GCK72_015476 [Caenorhabditis remanei]
MTPTLQESEKGELRIYKELDHPFIIKMLAAFQTSIRLCLVLELAAHRSGWQSFIGVFMKNPSCTATSNGRTSFWQLTITSIFGHSKS